VTNDGWFGHSTGPYQHFHQSRVRAVEESVPLIRAANNGISAVVDSYGRALQTLGLDVRGVIDSRLPMALPPTLYARLGDWMLVLVLAVFTAFAAVLGKSSR
jgi:apolipoprotein N-acyltransferase